MPSQTALIDFVNGAVYDGDNIAVIEISFTVIPDTPIGFFLLTADSLIYSDPALNFGIDYLSAYEDSSDPSTWGLLFEAPVAGAGVLPVSFNFITGLTPVDVPVPASGPIANGDGILRKASSYGITARGQCSVSLHWAR